MLRSYSYGILSYSSRRPLPSAVSRTGIYSSSSRSGELGSCSTDSVSIKKYSSMGFDADALVIRRDIDSAASESGTNCCVYAAKAVIICSVSASEMKSVSAKSKLSQ